MSTAKRRKAVAGRKKKTAKKRKPVLRVGANLRVQYGFKSVADTLRDYGIERFCDDIIEINSLRSIARRLGVSPSAVLKWIDADPVRKHLYALARAEQAEALASDLIEIADGPVGRDEDGRTDSGAVQEKRVRIDTRKWIAAKLKPQVYGDKIDLSGHLKVDLTPEQCRARAAVLMAKLGILGPAASASEVLAKLGINGTRSDDE